MAVAAVCIVPAHVPLSLQPSRITRTIRHNFCHLTIRTNCTQYAHDDLDNTLHVQFVLHATRTTRLMRVRRITHTRTLLHTLFTTNVIVRMEADDNKRKVERD